MFLSLPATWHQGISASNLTFFSSPPSFSHFPTSGLTSFSACIGYQVSQRLSARSVRSFSGKPARIVIAECCRKRTPFFDFAETCALLWDSWIALYKTDNSRLHQTSSSRRRRRHVVWPTAECHGRANLTRMPFSWSNPAGKFSCRFSLIQLASWMLPPPLPLPFLLPFWSPQSRPRWRWRPRLRPLPLPFPVPFKRIRVNGGGSWAFFASSPSAPSFFPPADQMPHSSVILVGLSSCHIEIFFQRFPFTISGFWILSFLDPNYVCED